MSEDGGYPPPFQESNHAQQHGLSLARVARCQEGGNRIEHDEPGLELDDLTHHHREVHLQSVQRRSGRDIAQQTRFHPLLQIDADRAPVADGLEFGRSEEHTSELQSLMRLSYAVFCLKKKKKKTH